MRRLVFRALAYDLMYLPKVATARIASVVTLSSRAADQSVNTGHAAGCYQLHASAGNQPMPPAGLCDPWYTPLNPWPGKTSQAIEWLLQFNHPWKVHSDGFPYYSTVDDIVLGLALLAALGIALGLRTAPLATLGLLIITFSWIGIYSVHHIEARYVAGAQALLQIVAWGGVGQLVALGAQRAAQCRPHDALKAGVDHVRAGASMLRAKRGGFG
jgi:hypothetical protein